METDGVSRPVEGLGVVVIRGAIANPARKLREFERGGNGGGKGVLHFRSSAAKTRVEAGSAGDEPVSD